MKAALLIIDMQKGLREETHCKQEFDDAIAYINAAAGMFRAKDLPIVVIQDKDVPDCPGALGFDVVEDLQRDGNEIIVQKEYCNAFWKTDLESILRAHSVDFVVASGFAAEHCVLFTYNGAVERGFKVSLLQKGIAGYDSAEIRNVQLLRPVISLQALGAMLS